MASKIALTYANDQHMDGAGAQLQRIYGIYAISRHLGIPYFHSPIKSLGYQGLAALERNASSQGLTSRFTDTFQIPSDLSVSPDTIVHNLHSPDVKQLISVDDFAAQSGNFHLVRILLPFKITDNDPELYRHVRALTPFRALRGGPFRIAIHVRRGELHVVASKRMLPNAYYIAVAFQLIDVLEKLQIPFTCELHTEMVSEPLTVTPDHHGIGRRILRDALIDPAADALEDFDVLPNLTKSINADPIETLRRMSTAAALVMSRSSFSYVAALLNIDGMPVYYPFWHAPMRSWLSVNVSDDTFKKSFERHAHRWRERST